VRNRRYPAAENITLEALLRRRRTTLARYLQATGVDTYDSLLRRCASMGVTPPTPEAFAAAHPTWVTSPAEGVVVVETPPQELPPEESTPQGEGTSEPATPKRRRRRADEGTGGDDGPGA